MSLPKLHDGTRGLTLALFPKVHLLEMEEKYFCITDEAQNYWSSVVLSSAMFFIKQSLLFHIFMSKHFPGIEQVGCLVPCR